MRTPPPHVPDPVVDALDGTGLYTTRRALYQTLARDILRAPSEDSLASAFLTAYNEGLFRGLAAAGAHVGQLRGLAERATSQAERTRLHAQADLLHQAIQDVQRTIALLWTAGRT